MIDDTDRDGDSFGSKFNDRNVSPAGLRGRAVVAHVSGADGMQPSPDRTRGEGARTEGLASWRGAHHVAGPPFGAVP